MNHVEAAPRVSLGVPVYNGEDYLETALKSLVAQSFEDLEIVISDNASTDRTEAICRDLASVDPRILYQRNERNLGAAPNYNAVFARARGTYFKWASHDDVVGADFIARCVEILDRDTAVSLAFSRFDYLDADEGQLRPSVENLSISGRTATQRIAHLVDREIESDDVFWSIFGLMRREQLAETRLIESYLASDQTLLFHIVLKGGLHQIPETLFFRREHEKESMIKHVSHSDRARWFDSSQPAPKIAFPSWRLLREHLAVLRRERVGGLQSAGCALHILRRYAASWRVMGGEVKLAMREWSRAS